VVSAGLLGAGAVTALLVAFGAIGNTTTVTQKVGTAQAASLTAASFSPAKLYADATPGTVVITASATTANQPTDTGTGFLINSRGDILTASHVVAGANAITVKLQDGTIRSAKVLGSDTATDTALLNIDPSGLALRPLPLGSSSKLAVGDPLAVIGNPFGYNRSLSTGVVSALDRTIQTPNGFTVAHAIQTDAAVNPGNSGGPMLSAQGQVVGIVDQIATGGSNIDSSTGVGFAVPIDVVKAELTQLENGQPVTHAYLGAGTSAPVTQDGAFVESVATGSPAARAGLRPRDVITAVDGTPLIGPNGLVAAVTADKPGTKITLSVLRGSTHLTLTATLGTQPSQAPTG
jgi:S1-C subfamily serine protease